MIVAAPDAGAALGNKLKYSHLIVASGFATNRKQSNPVGSLTPPSVIGWNTFPSIDSTECMTLIFQTWY